MIMRIQCLIESNRCMSEVNYLLNTRNVNIQWAGGRAGSDFHRSQLRESIL